MFSKNGEVYAPGPKGRQTLLLTPDRVTGVGGVGRRAVEGLGLKPDTIEATGCEVIKEDGRKQQPQ